MSRLFAALPALENRVILSKPRLIEKMPITPQFSFMISSKS
jgi:hypothetical protein